MPSYNLPILSNRNRTFTKIVGGRTIKVALIYNNALNNWMIYFADLSTGEEVPLVTGLALVTGPDILAQFKHLGLGSFNVIHKIPSVGSDSPTISTLKSEFYYIWDHE